MTHDYRIYVVGCAHLRRPLVSDKQPGRASADKNHLIRKIAEISGRRRRAFRDSDEYFFAYGSILSNRSFSKLVNNESGWNYMARKFEFYGASDCPGSVVERCEWGFFWRGRLTRRRRNLGKLGYAWSLHPKKLVMNAKRSCLKLR